jgi:hypothetical protein
MEPTMPTYTADFRTDADSATHTFEARSPRHALKKARAFHDEHAEELMFERYDDGHRVDEIAVRDANGEEVALWQDDDLRLRLAAQDLLDAGEARAARIAQLLQRRRKRGAAAIAAAIAKAKGRQP